MILLDVNILVYAHHSDMPQHKDTFTWLEGALVQYPRVALCWESIVGFIRVVTNPRIFKTPTPLETAWQAVDDLLNHPAVFIALPDENRHRESFHKLSKARNATGKLVPDAHLAALAFFHGLTLVSADADFAGFKGVKWFNPLA